MTSRNALTMAGVLAGAAVGAAAIYVAMKPKLRKVLKKKGISTASLALIGREMRDEAADIAQDAKQFVEQEARSAGRLPRRWFAKHVKTAQEAVHDSVDAANEV